MVSAEPGGGICGALGLITTLGVNEPGPCLEGIPPPLPDCAMLGGWGMKCWLVGGLGRPCGVWCTELGCRLPLVLVSAGGRGLLRRSLTFVVEDVGVPCAELEGD